MRIRALLLLGALLAGPAAMLAATVSTTAVSCDCGAGDLCPMHHNQKSQQDKMPHHGDGSSQQTCMGAAAHQFQPGVQQILPKATLSFSHVLPAPVANDQVAAFTPGPIQIRFVSPPEQPPRS